MAKTEYIITHRNRNNNEFNVILKSSYDTCRGNMTELLRYGKVNNKILYVTWSRCIFHLV